jgi:hypothetical protein
MRLLSTILLVAAAAGTSDAQVPKISRVEIVEAGVYRTEKSTTKPLTGVTTGTFSTLSKTELVEATNRVPGRLGASFGFRFQAVGKPANAKIALTRVNLLPQPGMHNPKTGNTFVREEFPYTATIGQTIYTGYTFDNDWEIVIGTWTLELWDDDRKLASNTFEVFKPD